MRVLGIDVGFATMGWSIVEKNPKKTNGLELIDYGAILTDSKDEMPDRLAQIYSSLNGVILNYNPTDMAVESLFYFKNQKTVMAVSQARGVILLTGELNKLKIFSYTPLQVKTSVTGYGRAEKAQIQKMIKLMFGLKEIPKPDDAADAVALAVCHINTYRMPLAKK